MAAGYDGSIRIDTKLDTSGFQKGVSGLPKQLNGVTKAANMLKGALVAAFAVDTIIAFGKAAIDLASDLQEAENVVDVAFGDMKYMVEDFADTAIEKFGMSQLAAKRTASTYMAMSKGMGISEKRAAEMALAVTGLTGDMASFYNVSQEVADTALKSIWTGETESLKQFGVVMTQTNLQQFAYQKGIQKNITAMTQAEQVQLRYLYVMEQLSMAQGDFARTSNSWANQTRILSENWKELMSILGSGLIEVLLPVVQFLNGVVKALIAVASAIGSVYRMLTGKEATTQTDKMSGALGSLSDSAADATEHQYGLADGISAASAAAKSALANFDDLDVLEQNLGSGGGFGGNFDVPSFSFDEVDFGEVKDNVESLTDDLEDILIGWRDDLQEDFVIQPVVAEPVFPLLPSPVWEPNWGLVPPGVPVPEFPELPSPVWEPNWGLAPPDVPIPVFPELPAPVWEPEWGLEPPSVPEPVFPVLPSPIWEPEWGLEPPSVPMPEFPELPSPIWEPDWGLVPSLETEFSLSLEALETFKGALLIALGITTGDVKLLLDGMGLDSKTTMENVKTNIAAAGENISANVKQWVTDSGNAFQQWKQNNTTATYDMAEYLMTVLSTAFTVTSKNQSLWGNSMSQNMVNLGNGMLNAAKETANGLVKYYSSAFQEVFDSWRELKKAIGEKVSSVWNKNKDWLAPTLAVTAAVTIGAIALSGGSLAAPLMAAAIPLATGAVIPPNQEFLAVLGDQKSGRNLEAPEGLIRQILREELAGLQSGGGDITIEFTGSLAQLARVLNPVITKEQKRIGKTLQTGGVL